MSVTGTTVLKHHGIWCEFKHKISDLFGKGHILKHINNAQVKPAIQETPEQPKVSIYLREQNATSSFEVPKSSRAERLQRIACGTRAYSKSLDVLNETKSNPTAVATQNYIQNTDVTSQTAPNPSAPQYLVQAAQWKDIANTATTDGKKALAVKRALESAKCAAVLGVKGGIKELISIFTSHNVPIVNITNSIMQPQDDILFWEKVSQKLEGKTSANSTPVMMRYHNPNQRLQNFEIAAEFITSARTVVNDLESLPPSLVTEWVQHFNNAISEKKLPNFDILRQQYQEALHTRSPQKVDIKI